MKPSRFRHEVAGVAASCFALTVAAAPSASAPLPLADGGVPRAAIVANGHEEPAKALAAYLERIVGAPFPVVETAAAVPAGHTPVVLEVADAIPGLSARRAAMQGYRIHTGDGRLHLTGRSAKGLAYAVYGFLDDHLGVRYFTPDFEVVPSRPTLAIKPLDEVREPAFLTRSFSQPYGHPLAHAEPLYREKNRCDTPHIIGRHNFYQWIPPADCFKTNPEWFPLIDGERKPHYTMPLCAGNPGLARKLAERFMEQMARMEAGERSAIGHVQACEGVPPMFSAGQGDGFIRCGCGDCRALAEREESEAAPYITLLNRALEITSETYPGHAVVTFAYFATLKAPKTLRPHSNLWINLVSSSLSSHPAGDQLGPIRGNPHNRDYREAIAAWTRLAPNRVTVWDWTGNFTDAVTEWPNILSVADNIRFFRENGVEAVFLEQPGGEQNWGWLRKWVWARMLWNPGLDPQALMREFIAAYYGEKAAPFIREYHRLVDRAARDSRHGSATVRWTAFPALVRAKLFPDDQLSAMTALMEGALAAAGEDAPQFRERVRQAVATSVDALLLTGAGAPARVSDPRDGSPWLVPGGRPDFPERIDRVADAWLKTTASGADSWHHRYRFLQRTGGALACLTNDCFILEALPAVRGQLYSLVHRATGKEVLAPGADMQVGGYTDKLPGATTTIGWQEPGYHRHWLKEEADAPGAGTLRMLGVPITSPWSTPQGRLSRRERCQLQRDVALAPDGGALVIARRYRGQRIKPAGQVFEAVWSLAVPVPARAAVTVREGAAERRFALGSLRDAAATPADDARPTAFSDVTLQAFDFTEGRALTLAVESQTNDLVITLDRGDGLAVELATPAAGNRTVALTPVLAENRLTVAIGSAPHALPEGKAAADVLLPPVTLRARVIDDSALPAAAVRTRGNPRDGAEMVWIPAGHFLMGSPPGEGNPDESPQRSVYLDGYWIYRHPVTVARYRVFCEATGRTMPKLPGDSDGDDHPMISVSWHDAAAYAAWAGAALPTEAQWEKAARGGDGRRYPWGDAWDPDRCVSDERTHGTLRYGTRPVGSRPGGASPCGALDMAGQVWEWTADWYAPDAYRVMFARNPAGPDRGTMKVLRGGSLNWNGWHSRSANRMPVPPRESDRVWTGFRCVVAEAE